MNLEDIRQLAIQLPGVTEDIKWEDHLCFNVGQKMFLVTSPDKVPITASFKVPDDSFNEFCEREGIIPAPYLARYKWVFIDDVNRVDGEEWKQIINRSYQLIFSKLSKKIQREINEG